MRQRFFIMMFFVCIGTIANAQLSVSPAQLTEQAQSALKQQDYTRSRYLYLQAYRIHMRQENYPQAIDCGTQAATLYYRDMLYKEAFDLCREMEQAVISNEQKIDKGAPDLHYKINLVRFYMYVTLKRPDLAKEYLNRLETHAKAYGKENINNDFLFNQAYYYYSFGMQQQGDAILQPLVQKYKEQKNYAKINGYYKKLIESALKTNNAGLVSRMYDQYMIWKELERTMTAHDTLSIIKRKYDESQLSVQEANHSLSGKTYIIIGLSIIIVLLIAGIIILGVILTRYTLRCRKLTKAISIAQEHNELKTHFIQNISTRMAPTLNTMDTSHPSVIALLNFITHVQEMVSLESTLTEAYELKEMNVATFCDEMMEGIRDDIQPEVTTKIDAPRIFIQGNQTQLERILMYLLLNAAANTPSGGNIWLEFKKRGGHSHQFIVTNTGRTIPEDMQNNLFKPFSQVRDLLAGDDLGLPICSLIAIKMNGTLSLDATYTKGCRFILELRN